jgi:hypothetical protein
MSQRFGRLETGEAQREPDEAVYTDGPGYLQGLGSFYELLHVCTEQMV